MGISMEWHERMKKVIDTADMPKWIRMLAQAKTVQEELDKGTTVSMRIVNGRVIFLKNSTEIENENK